MEIRTAECVSPMHPDKTCDRIADAILDAYLAKDKNARCAIEILGGHGLITITGEVTSKTHPNIKKIIHKILGKKFEIREQIVKQSPEIANGVDKGGAGDQGIMIGYACNENEEMVPQEYFLARSLAKFLYKKHKGDGKTQITLVNGKIKAVVASWANVHSAKLTELVKNWLKSTQNTEEISLHINPAGDWKVSGFDADSGLSGRKIVIDSYGPRVPVGGGSFSGKDATKVDRSAAYKARSVAVKLLKERNAKEVKVQVAYAIGVAYPIQLTALIDGTEENMENLREEFTPSKIISSLKLREPKFSKTADWGHFGRGFSWG